LYAFLLSLECATRLTNFILLCMITYIKSDEE
jgi:hypothetical protein